MKRENWQKVKQIFNDALEVAPAERKAFLAEACASDDRLRREVEILLNSFEADYLETPAVGQVADVIAEEQIAFKAGDKISDYRIERMLGAGGQGAVYLAEDLRLNRRVAIKFLPSEAAADSSAGRRFRREAQSAAAISHPNICRIHKIGEAAGRAFLVMQYVEGETLSARLKNGKLDLKSALDIAIQIADALDEAHQAQVVHRDIKPSNIVISANHQVTILDFGLAKQTVAENFASQSSITESGAVIGTASYMSPEQARGQKVDCRSDLWSLGVCLYEMAAGENPFSRGSLAETLAAILSFEPNFDKFPPPLAEILRRVLQKNSDERYESAKDLLADLQKLRSELSFEEQLRSRDLSLEKLPAEKSRFGRRTVIFAVSAILMLAVGGWFYRQNRNLNWARESVRRVEELARADKTFEAYDLALQVEKYLPDDENLKKLKPLISDRLTVKTEPAGARVFLKRFQRDRDGKFPERRFIGETPIENFEIARGQYLLYIEKEGLAAFTRSISGRLPNYMPDLFSMPPLEFSVKLVEAGQVPAKMIFVPGGEYKLVSYMRPTEKAIELDDFLIDKHEVSNREFKEFVAAGGYLKKDYWKIPFVSDGREISHEEAMRNFKDRTGLSAPRSWTNQNPPEGKEDFPVTDITWYEADAYAEFRGKSLPTIFQWEKAARDGKFDESFNTMPWGLSRDADSTDFLANFGGDGTMPVESFEFGASSYGCLNMAGNVAEWLLNKRGENVLVGGGSWGEKPYLFGYYGDFPPAYSSNKIGFRLVKNLSDGGSGAENLPPLEIPVYQASSDADFKKWLAHYVYDRVPLEAETVERIETDSWTREKITFVGANREKAIGYLYLPKNASRPVQVVHWIPAADVPLGFSSLPHSVEGFLSPIIKGGRAVFAVVLKGYNERPAPKSSGGKIEFRKEMISFVTDWRRGLDYLETRDDIDPNKIAFLGLSWGGNQGLVLTAVEKRYRAAAFVGAGVRSAWAKWIAEANLVNFAPHIAAPKLFLKGRYDEAHPLKTEGEPVFEIMREPKRLMIVESGHVPPPEIFAPIINDWLDETLGKIKLE